MKNDEKGRLLMAGLILLEDCIEMDDEKIIHVSRKGDTAYVTVKRKDGSTYETNVAVSEKAEYLVYAA